MRLRTWFLAAALFAPIVISAATRIRVAYYLEPGLCERLPDGTYVGATVDFLVSLAKINDWEIEPVYCTYDEALDLLSAGKIDLVGGVLASIDRHRNFKYSEFATGSCTYHLFVRADSKRAPGHFSSWRNIEIAVGPGNRKRVVLENYLKAHGIPYRLRCYVSAEEALKAFRCGDVDAVHALGVESLLAAKPLVSFPPRPSYFCVPNSREDLLVQLNQGILRLQSDEPDLETRVLRRYFPVSPRIDMELTAAERAWLDARIASSKPVTVDLTPELLPFKGWLQDGDRPVGLVCNILREVERRTGLTFSFIQPDGEEAARSRFLHHEVDFWVPLGVSVDDLPGYAGGISIASLPQILITKHGRQVPPLEKMRFGVPSWDSQWQSDYRCAGVSNLVPVRLLSDTLKDIIANRLDGVAVSLPQAILGCQNLNIMHRVDFLRLDSRLPYHQRIVLVPTARVNAELVSIITKCVESLTRDEVSALTYHAVTEAMPHMVLTDRQWIAVVAFLSFITLCLIAGTFAFFHRRLARALVLARAGERARTQFLATMSHEIRTPLNAVIGFSEFLCRPGLSESETRNYARGVRQSSRVLLNLINDVLDISKIESGKVDMRTGITDFVVLKHEFITVFSARVRKQGIRFVFTVQDGMPQLALSAQHMRQILLNLIGNAVKFTSKGHVSCDVRIEDGVVSEFPNLEITVSDTGIGISQDQLTTIFDPFAQDISTRGGHVYEGTGLGLPIVKRLVDAAGGSISVTSKIGEGASFTLRIPHVEVASGEARPLLHDDAAHAVAIPRSVLLVDDVPLNLMVLKTHFLNLGVSDVRTAPSGREALRMLSESPAEFVFTDMWMPEMDGASLARIIRADPALASTHVVAVTADVESENTFDVSVFDAVLTKPVTGEKLRMALGEIGGGGGAYCAKELRRGRPTHGKPASKRP